MSFSERLAAGQFPVALEITPPQTPLPKVLLRRARLLGDAACAVNVIQRPGRQSSLDASCDLVASGIEPAWHLVTRGKTAAEAATEIERAAACGVRQVLCIRGDHEAPDGPAGMTIKEAVTLARGHFAPGSIGVTLNQHVPDMDAALRNLGGKLTAGASYVQTQPVFDTAAAGECFAQVLDRWPATKVVAMAMPLLSAEAAARIEARLGVSLPEELHSRVARGEEAAWEAFTGTLAWLAASGLVHGVAIMTFEMDPPPAMGERIVRSLREAGIGG
ncbi:MAG: methylenetetrahydrofolate reductase [Chloroflexi bacterium]|nr:methylenetetrahydrofolate reductase [Chloroflexota bacterium]